MNTMRIQNPEAWVLILLIGLLIAIFLIKVGYRRHTVSTMLFWDDVCESARFALWGTRLRKIFAFAIACVFVLLMIAAILNPVSTGNAASNDVQLNSAQHARNNIAITRCEARRQTFDPKEYELLIEAVNFGLRPVTTSLSVELDGVPIHVSDWELTPDKPALKLIHGIVETGGTFRAELKNNLPDDDTRGDDNIAETNLPACENVKILCFGVSDEFLLKAIASQPFVSVETISSLPDRVPTNTIVVIQGQLPPQLPQGNIFIIEPKGSCELFTVGDAIRAPVVGKVADTPLTRFLSVAEMQVPGAKKISTLKAEDKPEILVSTTDGTPLLLQWQRASGRVIVFAAKPSQGEFVFRASFPLLIANMINTCRNMSDMQGGFRFALSLNDRLAQVRTHDLRANMTGSQAVNAVDTASQTIQPPSGQLLWFYFGWLAIVVSVVEWFLYHRRLLE